ncbi:MAG: J domain-containing protein [Sinimarinibacterium sp.]|jgi:curved DNA-binding protein CbpA
MGAFKTHYDNLQVKEDASPEVIKGAYRYLSQKWHPDKNPDNHEKAERVTKIINDAYAVLSDPARRKQHDEWIAKQRRAESAKSSESDSKDADSAAARQRPRAYLLTSPGGELTLDGEALAALVLIAHEHGWYPLPPLVTRENSSSIAIRLPEHPRTFAHGEADALRKALSKSLEMADMLGVSERRRRIWKACQEWIQQARDVCGEEPLTIMPRRSSD